MTVRVQLILLISLLSAAFGAFTAFYFPAQQRTYSLDALSSQLSSIQTLASDLLGPSILFDDIDGIESTASYILKLEEAAFIVIWDSNGTELVQRARAGYGDLLRNYLEAGAPRRYSHPQLIFSLTPIVNAAGTVGTLAVAFNTKNVAESVRSSVQASVIIGLIFLASGLGAALFVAIRLVQPLPVLTDAFVALSQGKFGHRVPEQGAAEFVQLSEALNRTGETLRSLFDEMSMKNEQLAAEILERRRAEQQIQASLDEKEVLLKEIHHRVKNNLQIISSLINLQSTYVEDPRSLEIFEDSKMRIRSMALIHENLYRSEDLARIEFGGYIRTLVGQLAQIYRSSASGVKLDLDIGDALLNIETAVPCGLIVTELVSNALKYAFPDGGSGRITVELLVLDNDMFELTVADDGIGFDPAAATDSGKTFGLQLVDTLVEQMEASKTVDGTNGTLFSIRFSELKYRERV